MCKEGLVKPLHPEEIETDLFGHPGFIHQRPAPVLSRLVTSYAGGASGCLCLLHVGGGDRQQTHQEKSEKIGKSQGLAAGARVYKAPHNKPN